MSISPPIEKTIYESYINLHSKNKADSHPIFFLLLNKTSPWHIPIYDSSPPTLSLQVSYPILIWDLNPRQLASVLHSLPPASSSSLHCPPRAMQAATYTRVDGSMMKHIRSTTQRAVHSCGGSSIAKSTADRIPCTSSIGGSPTTVTSRG